MKTKHNHHLLEIPLEFLIACKIYKLDPLEVLQIFINHVTVYDSIADSYTEGISEASKTISVYISSLRRTANGARAYKHCLERTALNFKAIYELAKRETGYAKAKRKKSLSYVDDLYATIERVYTTSDTFYLDENTTLQFTKDFTVMCELHNCYPAELLEHFMSRISLAEMEAKTGLKVPNDNFTMHFFMKIVLGFGLVDDETPDLTEDEIVFLLATEKMRLHIYTIRSVKERIAIFKRFYQKRYEQLTSKN